MKFGSVQSELRTVLDMLGNRRVWLLLDEWSEIPLDIQPYLADLIRRCILPIASVTAKFAAIDIVQISAFGARGQYKRNNWVLMLVETFTFMISWSLKTMR